jgi:hypothetical protein
MMVMSLWKYPLPECFHTVLVQTAQQEAIMLQQEEKVMNNIQIFFKFERVTKNKAVYIEVDQSGWPRANGDAVVGSLYVSKAKLPADFPIELQVMIELPQS